MTVKISNLPAATSVGSGDVLPVVQSGTTKKIDLNSPWSINIDGGNIDGTPIGVSSASSGAFTTLTASDDVNFDSGTLFVDASADRVGIGTTTTTDGGLTILESIQRDAGFDAKLSLQSVSANDYPALYFSGCSATNRYGAIIQTSSTSGSSSVNVSSSITFPLKSSTEGEINFATNGNIGAGGPSEAMRIDSSGNVLIGKTSNTIGGAGVVIRKAGEIFLTRAGDVAGFNRLTTDGPIIQFYKDGSVIGSIGNDGADLKISATDDIFFNVAGSTTSILGLYGGGGNNTDAIVDCKFYPNADNSYDLGLVSNRWDDIYATNGTIQTSDRNEKQDIEELTEAETRVAQKAKTLLRKFRWKSAVEEKGEDARIHFGIIAQDLVQAFEDEGLDAGRYAMFIRGEWWENAEGEQVEEGTEGAVKRERLGVRYSELLAFIISAI